MKKSFFMHHPMRISRAAMILFMLPCLQAATMQAFAAPPKVEKAPSAVEKTPSTVETNTPTKAAEPSKPVGEQDILAYLDQMIAWHRSATSLEVQPSNLREVLLRDAVRQRTTKIIHLGFEFARAKAKYMPVTQVEPNAAPENVDPEEQRRQRMMKSASEVAQHIAALQVEQNYINERIQKAPAKQRAILMARRDKLNGELHLAKAQQELLANVVGFFKDADNDVGAAGGLLGQINRLARSIPELQNDPQKAPPATESSPSLNTAATQGSVIRESNGIFDLAAEMFTLSRQENQLDDIADQTTLFLDNNKILMTSIRQALKDALARGKVIAQTSESDTPQKLKAQQQELEALVVRYKELSTIVSPLSEQNMGLKTIRRNLQAWQNSIDEQFNKAFRQLALRLLVLSIAVMIPIIISSIAHRATLRYISDSRRRRQLQIIRRILVGIAICLVVFGSFATEFGSLATFAGFLTAGLAVALQNVILSAVAYFFFFGRFGVRVGDRVTVSGVTGEVVEVGFIRLYLMELGGTNRELYPTGRIIAFSNSILFQPSAFFKQIPDTNYTWHEVTLTLPKGSDYQLAQTKLLPAVELVYAEYRESMERQQSALERSTHLKIQVPRPEGRLQLINSDIAYVIRYPVEIGRASQIDDRITKQLLTIIENEPSLKGTASTPPKIESLQKASKS